MVSPPPPLLAGRAAGRYRLMKETMLPLPRPALCVVNIHRISHTTPFTLFAATLHQVILLYEQNVELGNSARSPCFPFSMGEPWIWLFKSKTGRYLRPLAHCTPRESPHHQTLSAHSQAPTPTTEIVAFDQVRKTNMSLRIIHKDQPTLLWLDSTLMVDSLFYFVDKSNSINIRCSGLVFILSIVSDFSSY